MNYLHLLRHILNLLSSFLTLMVPRNKKIVLFSGSNSNTYNENSRYLYEYLNAHNYDGIFIWITSNNIIYNHLKKKKLSVLKRYSIKSIWFHMRAGITISCGMTPLNLLNFVSKKAIKISLNHGCGPRSTSGIDTSVFKNVNQLLERVHKFDYFNFTSDFTSEESGQKQFKLPKDKIIKYGFPRCDHLFDKKNIEYLANKKELLKKNAKIKDINTKCILYSPTWRPTQLTLPKNSPIELLENFNLIDFDRWLKNENINLFISKHPRDNSALNLNECSQINYLNQHNLFDINQLLPEIDILITDYSSIATDFMIMNRPVLYIMPDYDAYLRSYGLLEDFLPELPGYNVSSLEELKKYISDSILDPLEMSHARNKYLKKYYDCNLQTSSLELSKLIDYLIKK